MAEIEAEITRLRKLQKEAQLVSNQRQQALAQVGENEMVISELSFLEEDAKVYKLIGPVLVQQDLLEVKVNVNKRIELIKKDVTRIEKQAQELEKKAEGQRQKVVEMQHGATGRGAK